MTSLYYFRGVRGRRAMVLLSDGDDTASAMAFRDALEYARRSGVTIYTIGLNVGKLQTGVRGKLNDLAKETGGRSFFISRPRSWPPSTARSRKSSAANTSSPTARTDRSRMDSSARWRSRCGAAS